MASWQTVAVGTSIGDLEATLSDFELKKGDRMRVIMDLPSWLPWNPFDLAGAEWVFQPYVPDGMDLIDVWGEGRQGIVELEADPVWLVAALGFIKAHWLAIIIAGFLLTVLVTTIIVQVKIAQAPALPIAMAAIIGGLAIVGIIAYSVTRRGGT